MGWLFRRSVAALLLVSCTDTYLYDERNEEEVPVDRALSLEGQFCTPSPASVVRPIKILLAMDASQSIDVTDPDGTRVQAMLDLDGSWRCPTMMRSSSRFWWCSRAARLRVLINPMVAEFHQLNQMTPADRLDLAGRLATYQVAGTMPNRDSTDFVKPLSDIYALLTEDIATTRLPGTDQTAARYTVIFLSDGHPTTPEDDQLLCGDDVVRIRELKDLADDVTFNTVFVFDPAQDVTSTICDLDGGSLTSTGGGSTCLLPVLPAGSCPLLIVNQDSDRLQVMAQLGGGDFRDFRNHEPINFLNFNFGEVRHTFSLDKLIASNFSAPPDSDVTQADSDSDGLLDVDELKLGTNPWVADTDGDGFSDGVEVYFAARGGSFDPTQMLLPDGTCVNSKGVFMVPDGGTCLDTGCPEDKRGLDSDCDGLTDCDEQLIGTNSLKVDTDDDGIPDAVEWQMKTSPSDQDLGQDLFPTTRAKAYRSGDEARDAHRPARARHLEAHHHRLPLHGERRRQRHRWRRAVLRLPRRQHLAGRHAARHA